MASFNFNTLNLGIEVATSFGMLVATIGALIYIYLHKERATSAPIYIIIVTLGIAFAF